MSSALAAEGAPRRKVVTPEGIALPFEIASVGDRITAFLLDIVILFGALIVLYIGAAIVIGIVSIGGEGTAAVMASFVILAAFFLRNFYFIFMELRGTGMTWGKRKFGLRVIARNGGPLTAEMVFARNMLRELEFFIPIVVLIAPQALMPNMSALQALGATAWLLVFLLMPLFGKDHLRCGDLVAGTLVIKVPHLQLLPDLTQTRRVSRTEVRRRKAQPELQQPQYQFTPEQLEMYGIHELQVLEDLLRKWDERRVESHVLKLVVGKIMHKIGWTQGDVSMLPFLKAFYKAQRAHLEKRMLFGQRRERKKRGRIEH